MSSDTASGKKKTWPWPDSLDALNAAPEHHSLLFENDRVRVLDVHIGRGQSVPLHTHRWPAVMYVLSAGDIVRRDADGDVTLDTRKLHSAAETPSAIWSEPLPPHSVENVGNSDIYVISVELKD